MRRILAALLLTGLVGTACGGGAEEPTGNGTQQEGQAEGRQPPAACTDVTEIDTVHVDLTHDLTFDPSCLIVTTDQRFEIENVDTTRPHTFTISEKEYFRTPFLLDTGRLSVGEGATVGPLESGLELGFYPLFCILHIGMKGEVYVAS